MGNRVSAAWRGLGHRVGAVGRGLKQFTMRFGSQAGSYISGLWLPRTNFNYAKEIGDGSRSNIVQAVVNWIARTFPEAPVMVVTEQADGTKERMHGHRLPKLLERPNPYYSGVLMWMATLVDWSLTGNAYWIKERVRGGPLDGMVERLWWAPEWTMEPVRDDTDEFVTRYEYKPSGEHAGVPLKPSDVVHFRYGMDPDNTMKGCSPLRSLMREIFTDEEAANFTAVMMKNLGVPGVMVSPETGNSITVEQAADTKHAIDTRFTGDGRGGALVNTAPLKMSIMAFSPEQMLLRDLRRVPEERVTAIYGVAAVVVGLGAGLDRATFSNFAEAREAAYEGNIIPTQRLIAADLTLQLLPDFTTDDMASVEFDLTKVRVLQPDMDKVATRMSQAIRDGWAMVADGKRELGLPVTDEDFVYLRSKNIDAVKPDNTLLNPPTVTVALPAPSTNGHRAEVPV